MGAEEVSIIRLKEQGRKAGRHHESVSLTVVSGGQRGGLGLGGGLVQSLVDTLPREESYSLR